MSAVVNVGVRFRSYALCVGTIPLAGSWTVACNRSEPDPPSAATGVRHPEVAPVPNEAPGRCIVKLPATPPPHGQKSPTCPPDPGGMPPISHGSVSFVDAPGAPRIAVEIATTSAWHERGLMYRTSMPDEQGMLFSWDTEGNRSFWMHDTCIPLDMLYVALDGTIVGVLEEVPAMDETPRAVPCPAAHVLEVNAGYTRAHGILPGQRLKIET
jgi:uncharacterized membrane protein (UPF0127 family)